MGLSTVRGKFNSVSGTAEYDPANPASLSVSATIDVASVDTGQDARDTHLKSADFFDVEKFPTMTFVSKSWSAETKELVGDLTLHGVTKEVTLKVDGPEGPATDPYGGKRLGANATTSINRKDFGLAFHAVVDTGALLVGDEVKITLEIQLVAA
jgi:polyisoprenoid-binding protein YceI